MRKRLDNLDMSRETTAKERDLGATQKDLSQTQEELDAALVSACREAVRAQDSRGADVPGREDAAPISYSEETI